MAYFLWTFLELGNNSIADDVQLLRIRSLCRVYGFTNGVELLQSLINEQQKVLIHRERLSQISKDTTSKNYNIEKVKQVLAEIEWVKTHTAETSKL